MLLRRPRRWRARGGGRLVGGPRVQVQAAAVVAARAVGGVVQLAQPAHDVLKRRAVGGVLVLRGRALLRQALACGCHAHTVLRPRQANTGWIAICEANHCIEAQGPRQEHRGRARTQQASSRSLKPCGMHSGTGGR